jgi:flagellar export protein FliJ
MSVFRFRLATLLRLREAARDQRRAELAEALRADNVLVEQLRSLASDLEQLLADAIRTASPGRVNIDRLVTAGRYELLLRAQQQSTERQRELLAQEIAKRQAALVEADREVRVLEKLRDVHQQRHREKEEQREQAQLDEIALRRYQREEMSA